MTNKVISLLFLVVGVVVLMQILMPTLSFKIFELKILNSTGLLVSPQSSKSVLGVSIKNDGDFPTFISSQQRETPASYSQFMISVPSIGLNGVNVYVDSNDLSKGLVHLPGTALPGEKGNIFVSGHSSIPVFEKNVQAFFANLPKVKKDDVILVSAAGAVFNYKIVSLKIVDPKDVSVILPPDTSGRYISLMTCVPPGFNTKRLIVLGKLI